MFCVFATINHSSLLSFILPYKAVCMFFSLFYLKPLVTPLFIQLFWEGEDLMKTVQLLYNNNINNFLYSRIKKQIFKNICNIQIHIQ